MDFKSSALKYVEIIEIFLFCKTLLCQEAELSQTLQVLKEIAFTLCQCLFGFLPPTTEKHFGTC